MIVILLAFVHYCIDTVILCQEIKWVNALCQEYILNFTINHVTVLCAGLMSTRRYIRIIKRLIKNNNYLSRRPLSYVRSQSPDKCAK
jgi:hypothetical protein